METGLVKHPYLPLNESIQEFSESIVSITDFNEGRASLIFKSLEKTKRNIVVRYNQPIGILLSIDAFVDLTEEVENNALFAEALQRLKKKGRTYSKQEVLETLGISENELEMVEEDEID